MNKPRLLVVAPFPPPVHGAAMMSLAVRDSKRLQERFRMDCINLSTSRRVDEIRQMSFRKILRLAGALGQTCYRLLFRRYDVCYLAITCYGVGFLKDAPFVALCKLFGKKVVLHQHNKGMSRYVHRKPYCWLLPWIYRHTSVMLLSWKLYPDVEAVVRKEQVLICPNGIPSFPLGQWERKEADAPVRMLFLSNLIESKGVYILLDACRILKEKGYRLVCDVVGGEGETITCDLFEDEIRQRGLEGTVLYQGPQYGADKERFWQEADLFVQPTYEDCFPLTLLEAMQHALPIVSTDEGAIPDLVIDGVNGFICKRKNVDSFVNAIEKLLNDKELRKQMGKNGRLRYQERYTLEAFDKRLEELLSGLLN